MQKHTIRFSSEGEPSLLVLQVAAEHSASGEACEVFAVPLFSRNGGMLLAVPEATLADSVFAAEEDVGSASLFGPGDSFGALLHEESDEGLSPIGLECVVQVFDVADVVLLQLREFDPVTDSTEPIKPYHPTSPHCVPFGEVFMSRVREWVKSLADGGGLFYSAQEDLGLPTTKTPGAAVLEKLDVLATQMQLLMNRQDFLEEQSKVSTVPDVAVQPAATGKKLPAVSAELMEPSNVFAGPAAVQKAMTLAGPPPRHRDAKTSPLVPPAGGQVGGGGGSSLEVVLAEQSSALTSLVAHLANQSPDSLGELSLTGASSSTSGTRGVLRRERMQSELAARSGGFYLQLMQQMHRRLHPGRPVPQSLSELRSLSMLNYLERQGGYRNQRESGLLMWLLGHVVDCINAEDWAGVRELMALTVVALEQSVVDQGDWSLAFLMSLVAEPPVQMFQDRSVAVTPHGRPFAPLCPAQWAATTLGYLKDMETLSSKKTEIVPQAKQTTPSSPPGTSGQDNPSPKRKQRFPKKVKPDA